MIRKLWAGNTRRINVEAAVPLAGAGGRGGLGRHVREHEGADRGGDAPGRDLLCALRARVCGDMGIYPAERGGAEAVVRAEGGAGVPGAGDLRGVVLLPDGEHGAGVHAGDEYGVPGLLGAALYGHFYAGVQAFPEGPLCGGAGADPAGVAADRGDGAGAGGDGAGRVRRGAVGAVRQGGFAGDRGGAVLGGVQPVHGADGAAVWGGHGDAEGVLLRAGVDSAVPGGFGGVADGGGARADAGLDDAAVPGAGGFAAVLHRMEPRAGQAGERYGDELCLFESGLYAADGGGFPGGADDAGGGNRLRRDPGGGDLGRTGTRI